MKYESTILKRLIDTYGVVGNPRYISEIIKEFIVRGKERFPELFTYQADWLAHIDEFGLNPTYTVSYTGQSIYAPNTLERPVKRAILSGNTLLNLLEQFRHGCSYDSETGIYTSTQNEWVEPVKTTQNVKVNVPYTLIAKVNTTSDYIYIRLDYNEGGVAKDSIINGPVTPNSDIFIKTTVVFSKEDGMRFVLRNAHDGVVKMSNIMLIEGDHTNQDIPYFEGMASCKMPVLTTTGKNLYPFKDINFQPDSLNTWYMSTGEKQSKWGNEFTKDCGIGEWFYLEEGRYSVSSDSVISSFQIVGEGEVIKSMGDNMSYQSGWYTFRVKSKADDLTVIQISNIQIEKSSKVTSYEPHKSNILSTPEDLELRGIRKVKDELNLSTGELTQRIVQKVFNGSEAWSPLVLSASGLTDYVGFGVEIENANPTNTNSGNVIDSFGFSNVKLGTINNNGLLGEAIALHSNGNMYIRVLKTRLTTQDTAGFKAWLAQTPLTVCYELKEKVHKTVDLTILDQNGQNVKQLMSFNGGTHFITGSLEGSPLPSVSVSVETDLEETLKVCYIEGNTM